MDWCYVSYYMQLIPDSSEQTAATSSVGDVQGFMPPQVRMPPNGYLGVLTHFSVILPFHSCFFSPQKCCWSQGLGAIVVPLKIKMRVLCKSRVYDPHEVGSTGAVLESPSKYLAPCLPHLANLSEEGSWVPKHMKLYNYGLLLLFL